MSGKNHYIACQNNEKIRGKGEINDWKKGMEK